MTLQAAIIADDLTGALDTGTPFVAAGLSVAVAIDVEAAQAAIATGCDVLVINTASRALSEREAAERVRSAAEVIRDIKPSVVMKKIDSRLKGNVAAESLALKKALGLKTILVAPAIPDQERVTYRGCVVGRGVNTPLPIAMLFAGSAGDVVVADAEDESDLDQIVEGHDWLTTLGVGARGLGAAFARRLGETGRRPMTEFTATPRTLFAFGSRDPITSVQMNRLEASGALRVLADAPMGKIECGEGLALPALLRCTGEMEADAALVARRFAAGVRLAIDDTRPEMLMVGGGDTALAVFQALGVRVLAPKGEIEAGIPWFDITAADGRQFRCAVKSGGFGNPDSLLKLVLWNQAA
ncbi:MULTISPECIES: four-carbon acid sugar kinase family protein [unclassified Rhizobium]|uniref:four-carbon acid sugar kinase family protein n=1 Tax=unclassified Rhizobium TaxID=2613769 RepID=UPI001A97E6F2|nr:MULTISPECIES: four-carbon acid sugar kinase family protein [unclassified Rhizobium]MBX5159294.1 four-carbon acid sugar kinase family protein [Rhizobium sp. NZLR8]MBX5171088.1 four-carbon acid sugar kinase family protein [Rhizobium sp. NZLR1b]MBX5188097.1 four-carbon acid sugar kinase family protein [Rhizobium sp. NZLR3b]MBX5200563.1 four-carbon acid sugar kinase family protein [Rhizobium sp. NZLR1]QSZ24941.1 four-carbon acid sugar kinase family protein [Rhizobium sp. NZLR1]